MLRMYTGQISRLIQIKVVPSASLVCLVKQLAIVAGGSPAGRIMWFSLRNPHKHQVLRISAQLGQRRDSIV